jgi:tellurite resistance protein TehA-like permease
MITRCTPRRGAIPLPIAVRPIVPPMIVPPNLVLATTVGLVTIARPVITVGLTTTTGRAAAP